MSATLYGPKQSPESVQLTEEKQTPPLDGSSCRVQGRSVAIFAVSQRLKMKQAQAVPSRSLQSSAGWGGDTCTKPECVCAGPGFHDENLKLFIP